MARPHPSHFEGGDPRALFAAAPVSLIALDTDLRAVAVSDTYLELSGAQRQGIIGRTLAEILPAPRSPAAVESIASLLRAIVAGDIHWRTSTILDPSTPGDPLWQVQTKAVVDELDRIQLIILRIERVAVDASGMSTYANHHADLLRSNAELEQFAYIASHDLQEPLRMIMSYLQVLALRHAEQLDPSARKHMTTVVGAAERMRTMITAMLEFARTGSRAPVLAPVASEEALADALVNLEPNIAASEARVQHGPLPPVLADRVHLARIFQNLIGNALKFRSSDGVLVQVEACAHGDFWKFSVADNGVGIPDGRQHKLFRVFERAHSERYHPGTGIGLAICKRLVEHHGGRIWFESREKFGATFFFTLPKVPDAQPT